MLKGCLGLCDVEGAWVALRGLVQGQAREVEEALCCPFKGLEGIPYQKASSKK